MLTKDEEHRIASAANALRPDWSIASIMAVIGDRRIRQLRTYRDTSIAMIWIASDDASLKPTRILAEGPWWEATRPLGGVSASAFIGHPEPSECDVCFRPAHWRHVDHVYQPRNSSGHGSRAPAVLLPATIEEDE